MKANVPPRRTEPSKNSYIKLVGMFAALVVALVAGNRDGRPSLADLCPVCRKNRGAQPALEYGDHDLLANPFGAFEDSYTIVYETHRPQSPLADEAGACERALLLMRLVSDGLGDVAFYNGADVGNSLGHDHAQAVDLPGGIHIPLLDVAGNPRHGAITIVDRKAWPLPAFLFSGEREEVARLTGRVAGLWGRFGGTSARANLLAVKSGGEIRLIYIPRSSVFVKPQGLSGAAGSLEVAGLILACAQADQQAILSGNLRFCQLWAAMRGLAPENVDRLVAEVRAWS